MGRPKGSKNKKTLVKEARVKGVAKARKAKTVKAPRLNASPRGRKKQYARAAQAQVESSAAGEVQPLNPITQKFFDTQKALVDSITQLHGGLVELMRTSQVMLRMQTSAFLDAWFQYSNAVLKNDQEPNPSEFMSQFPETSKIVGISAQDLLKYSPRAEASPTPQEILARPEPELKSPFEESTVEPPVESESLQPLDSFEPAPVEPPPAPSSNSLGSMDLL